MVGIFGKTRVLRLLRCCFKVTCLFNVFVKNSSGPQNDAIPSKTPTRGVGPTSRAKEARFEPETPDLHTKCHS